MAMTLFSNGDETRTDGRNLFEHVSEYAQTLYQNEINEKHIY